MHFVWLPAGAQRPAILYNPYGKKMVSVDSKALLTRHLQAVGD